MDRKKLYLPLAQTFCKKKVLLIGDSILDHYVYGTKLGLSAETPTLVAKELKQVFSLGGAFLVCRNLLQLNVSVIFYTLVGSDNENEHVLQFSDKLLKLKAFVDEQRKTTIKRRFWVDGYKLLQFDQLDNRPLNITLEKKIISALETDLKAVDLVIISDYRHGLLTPKMISTILWLANKQKILTFIDSQVSQSKSNHELYKSAFLVSLNLKEAQSILPNFLEPQKISDFLPLVEKLKIPNIVLKLGEKGSVALFKDKLFKTPAAQVIPVDTCGAGDAFLAALSAIGFTKPQKALSFANLWAGLSTTLKGAEPPSLKYLENFLS